MFSQLSEYQHCLQIKLKVKKQNKIPCQTAVKQLHCTQYGVQMFNELITWQEAYHTNTIYIAYINKTRNVCKTLMPPTFQASAKKMNGYCKSFGIGYAQGAQLYKKLPDRTQNEIWPRYY